MRILLALSLSLAGACSSPPVPDEVTGVIVEIDRGDAEEIVGFTVEGDGSSYGIRIDPARDYGFDLEHLVEHQTTGDPVIVTTEARDGTAYAVEILDA